MRKKQQRARNSRVQLIVFLVLPMLLINAASMGCAMITYNQTKTYMDLSPASYEIEVTDYWIKFYNGLGYEIQNMTDGSSFQMIFTDDWVFPGWELILVTEIHNDGSDCNLIYTIYYSNQTDPIDWTQTDEAGLFNAVGMQYNSTFYLDKLLTDPMPTKYNIAPDQYVYHSEHLLFDPNEQFDQLSGKNFTIRIVVQAVHPDPTPYLNFGGT